MPRFASVLCLFLAATVCAAQENSLLLLQKPTLSRTQIIFVYAGDLWSVPRSGGDAIRLTTGAGVEKGSPPCVHQGESCAKDSDCCSQWCVNEHCEAQHP